MKERLASAANRSCGSSARPPPRKPRRSSSCEFRESSSSSESEPLLSRTGRWPPMCSASPAWTARGLEGVEFFYDSHLRGADTSVKVLRDAHGERLPVGTAGGRATPAARTWC
ncbi:MAG: hypothetical protein MZV70_20140 [Desulfobacterales bacterium]|nr:hypothetical protein [Desulfobacterales bacterium]